MLPCRGPFQFEGRSREPRGVCQLFCKQHLGSIYFEVGNLTRVQGSSSCRSFCMNYLAAIREVWGKYVEQRKGKRGPAEGSRGFLASEPCWPSEGLTFSPCPCLMQPSRSLSSGVRAEQLG